MMNIKSKNSYLIACIACLLILMMICYFNFNIRGTRSHFGGVTGTLTPWYLVTYSSNYPDTTIENKSIDSKEKRDYIILDNMFENPSGYEFSGWNTLADGTGATYLENSSIILTNDLYLYAQWTEILVDEDNGNDTDTIVYGDVNQNGEIDNDDYLLIENYISGIDTLTKQALLNADVNEDGNVDVIDVDIIKQSYLGTDGYTGYLPTKPILIYDIYVENSDSGKDEGTGSGSSGNVQGNTSSGSGIGSGSSNTSGNNGNNNNNSNNSSHGNTESSDNVENTKVIYEFKYMVAELEYDLIMCEATTDLTCELILPLNNPVMDGYEFSGWSLNKNCDTDNKIIAPVIVNSSNTYYACFEEIDVDNIENNKKSYVWIIVIFICIIAFRLILYLVNRFRKGQKNNI